MIKKVEEIPPDIENGSFLEIISTKITYFTHGFFKYPCKFIPQIPRWAILKYSNFGDLILDPFSGSGTTLVEAVLNGRNGLAIDFDKFAQLLCEVKTKILSVDQLNKIKEESEKLFYPIDLDTSYLPDIHNLNHWFSEENIFELLKLKNNIIKSYESHHDEEIYKFFLVCFASIIRKCSFADDVSPKPYVSKRIIKIPSNVRNSFLKTLNSYLSEMLLYTEKNIGICRVLESDARNINSRDIGKEIDLAITSPPYINAFDYVRSLRLENAWLGFYGDSNIINVKNKQVGTEYIPSGIYSRTNYSSNNEDLDLKLSLIKNIDKKRAFVVYKYFEDMKQNILEIHRILKPGGHYVIVVGDSVIRGVHIPTNQYLSEIAIDAGFSLDTKFSYKIKNRYLRIPRSGLGGNIDQDWVLDLRK